MKTLAFALNYIGQAIRLTWVVFYTAIEYHMILNASSVFGPSIKHVTLFWTPSPVTLCHTSRDPRKVRHTSRTPRFLVVCIHNYSSPRLVLPNRAGPCLPY